jgi:hypothetical protein
MLLGQGAIPLLTARASRWPRGCGAARTPGIQQGATTRGAVGNARQEGFIGVSSQMGAGARML